MEICDVYDADTGAEDYNKEVHSNGCMMNVYILIIHKSNSVTCCLLRS